MSLPFYQLASPLNVPIQRVPSHAATSLEITLEGRYWFGGGSQGTFRTPSNRDNPNAVPTQRYPSGVWAIERMEPLTKPSRIFQAVCAYWLTSSAGFSANVQGAAISRPASIALATLPFTVCKLRPAQA